MINPTWFGVHNLPYADMLSGDATFFPPILAGKKIIGEVDYGPFQQTLRSVPTYRIVDTL